MEVPLFSRRVLDMNYFLGIRPTDNVLVADFEEGTGQTSPGHTRQSSREATLIVNELSVRRMRS
jgi:hypothetical protein